MSAYILSIAITGICFLGAIVLVALAFRSAKKNALDKIKSINSKLSNKIENAKPNKAFTLAK